MSTHKNMLGLVELTDTEKLRNNYGNASFKDFTEVFNKRIENWVRSKDEWQQIDGNRFFVVLKDIGSRGELELATAKLARLFKEPHYQFGRAVKLDIAAGFTQLEEPGGDRNQALQEAESALKQAKKFSRFYDIYTPQNKQSADEERELVKRMERALEQSEFELYFQPKVHAQYQSLLGAEALIRWITTDKEIINPVDFIEVAERNDIIAPITWWVVKAAIARLARWPEELSIAVNIPPNLLLGEDIISVVRDSLDIYGVSAERLTLEVTERVMIDNHLIMMQQLARLKEIGVKISLDDFGTGFSSLAYFRDLPVDEIKIDKGFVLRMLESEKDHAIVKAVIDLAHNFSMRVVAEGVESLEIATRLSELDCDILQGYVFDRPLSVEAFEAGYGIDRNSTPLKSSAHGKTQPPRPRLM